MRTLEAPAKVNLSLHVSPPAPGGYHPLQSLVQTIEWCDMLEVEPGEGKDTLDSEIEDNLVLRAVVIAREFGDVPALSMRLVKQIPVAAGLGGGSSDAAAALVAASDMGRVSRAMLPSAASRVGADVSLFLVGGTLAMAGFGEVIDVVEPLDGFALAVAVPPFGISTAQAYQRWDAMEGPEGRAIDDERLPPGLRGGMPLRNDLLPAALDLEPRLGDFMSDLAAVWGSPVCLTGSGSACFGYFATLEEAEDAAAAVAERAAVTKGVDLRDHGVSWGD